MKKLLFMIAVIAANYSYAQLSKLAVYNYSSYKLVTRFGANGPSSCYPAVLAVPAPGTGSNTFSAGSPSAPFISEYTYSTSNASAMPVYTWWVRTSLANPGIDRAYNHPAVNPTSAVSTSTDWTYFIFQAQDSSNNPYGDFSMGTGTCNGTLNTYQVGTYAEAEWFTLTSGGTAYTVVQVF
ncbi:hypothetical protein ASG22_05770 [Chryseobacterium sp. Leaf405]|uniref:hypothetical protein n=1 Tax=Chryseobacterium sp. Leaf405 TaxID=1736367 RepID=UPI0006F6A5FC|nr:hypothetical protein [Chryseobacterium sp. Leaf405]KQT26177.1 hypothetical protein ASG22_05770 [Chryseobacterium sp. Leaf405]